MKKTLLVNPISPVHIRNVELFKEMLPEFTIRRICNPRLAWFSEKDTFRADDETFYFSNGHFQSPPKAVFEGVEAVLLFTAQSRVPPCNLIQQAILRRIPVVAVEEVYMMMLEQGYVNNYVLPVDRLFVGSEYERGEFLKLGVPEDVAETTGNIFRQKPSGEAGGKRRDLKHKMGLSPERPVAALCMALLAPYGDTKRIREEYLGRLSQGLSPKYQLLIRPHPSERGEDFENFVKSHAPNAKIASPSIPIGGILDVADVLFNRGNSMVIIDALDRGIPAIPIPVERDIFFDGVLDEIVVRNKGDVEKAMAITEEKGMSLYRPVFEKYLSIPPEQALENVASSIRRIARTKELYKPDERLLDLAIFWAWMGYPSQGLVTLSHLKGSSIQSGLLSSIEKLIRHKATRDEIAFLKKWSASGYKEWLIQSLWIKTLYLTGRPVDPEEKAWLSNFPPRMNWPKFVPYVALLYWFYVGGGMREEAYRLTDKIEEEYGFVEDLGMRGRLKHVVAPAVKNVLWKFETLTQKR